MRKLVIVVSLVFMVLIAGNVKVSGDSLSTVDNFSNIVIFVRFNDESTYSAPYDYDFYYNMFNGVDTVSLRDYYLEASYDGLTIDSYLPIENGNVIFYTDINDRSYYEPYDEIDNPNGYEDRQDSEREHALLKRAIDYVDEFNLIPDDINLDVNEDGELDSITFMISGEDNGWNSLLWPHKWELYSYYDNEGPLMNAPSINGVYPKTYTFELLGNDPDYYNQVDVGVLAHETFHLLSAPDLYHYYNYTNVEAVGDWGIMDNTSSIPSHMLGYMKYQYGQWIDSVDEIAVSGTYTLYPMQDSPDNLYKISTGITDEWLYVEYRDDLGLYESQLPDTGLLVYRVNNKVIGNDEGSYDDEGNPTDELWIYRPYMDDITPPIILEDVEDIIDGDIDLAALSQSNAFDSVGINTDIDLFSSTGDILNIGIYNVTESNGYITFDVLLEPAIALIDNGLGLNNQEVTLYDNEMMEYLVEINNIPNTLQSYYTLDGTMPTIEDTLYTGESIEITSSSNKVTVAIFDGNELVSSLSREFTFSPRIESNHSPYGNMVNTYWYFAFEGDFTYTLAFDQRFALEVDYDYLYITTTSGTEAYTGTELALVELEFNNSYLLLNLVTDTYVDDEFGFEAMIEVHNDVGINIIGDDVVYNDVFETYIEQGYQLYGDNLLDYTVEVLGTVDSNVVGNYVITYNVLNDLNEIVTSKNRTVTVVDNIAPIVTLIGEADIYLEYGDTYLDQGVNTSDNYDSEVTVEYRDSINEDRLGIYFVTYEVTDSSGNITILTRTVRVVDTTAPEVSLNEGIDTFYTDQLFTDGGVTYFDNFNDTDDLIINIQNDNDLSIAGTYPITYTVTDSSGNETVTIRMVNVLEAQVVYDIACNYFVSTISINEELRISSCFVNGTVMNTDDSDVNLKKQGLYQIVDTLLHEGVEYQHIRYVYVQESIVRLNEIAYIEKRRDVV